MLVMTLALALALALVVVAAGRLQYREIASHITDVWVEADQPTRLGDWVLRLIVHNDGPTATTLQAKVEAVSGHATTEFPSVEKGWWIPWRQGGADKDHTIPAGSFELLNLADAPGVDAEAARKRSEWRAVVVVEVIDQGLHRYGVLIDGADSVDALPGRALILGVKVWESDTGRLLVEKQVSIGFVEEGAEVKPTIEVSTPAPLSRSAGRTSDFIKWPESNRRTKP